MSISDPSSPPTSESPSIYNHLLLAAVGSWSTLPHLSTDFELTLEPLDSMWCEDLIQRGWEMKTLNKAHLKIIRAQSKVIWAELSFPSSDRAILKYAQSAAHLLHTLAQRGATALYFDNAMKVMSPELFKDLHPQDSITLFHLFVDVWGDEDQVITEGMEVFGVPDIRVIGASSQSAASQATAFSAAAQMICDQLTLSKGEMFRASESFPLFQSLGVTIFHSTQDEGSMDHKDVQGEDVQGEDVQREDVQGEDVQGEDDSPKNPNGVITLCQKPVSSPFSSS